VILEVFSASPSCCSYRPLTSIRRPSPQAAPFVLIIVQFPIIQTLAMALGLLIVAIELPLPQLKSSRIYRSIAFRIVILIFQTFLGILFYQVITFHFVAACPAYLLLSKGTNAALWSFIATICYTRSLILGETIEEAKENRRTAGGA
jgi:hypothetical protein